MNEISLKYENVLCSKQFIKKFSKKKFRGPVQRNKFRNMVSMIASEGKNYGTKVIGEFFISPRGDKKERIAWFKSRNKIYFYEPLHHEGTPQGDYEQFVRKASSREILRSDYSGWKSVETFMSL